MINFININKDLPYSTFVGKYNDALLQNQNFIEAVVISSYSTSSQEVDSRYVNLKYIKNNEWIFFSNYNGTKAKSFREHDQISALFFWDTINTQIRIKGRVFKTSDNFSDKHFSERSIEKNALSISSSQSKKISSYNKVNENYLNALKDTNRNTIRPSSWGGFSFLPYYFEFWEGNNSRINKRKVYELIQDEWKCFYLEP